MNGLSQEALDRASFELQRHFGREGSIYGIKACEEIARIALTAYGTVPEVVLADKDGLTETGRHIAQCEKDAARYRWLRDLDFQRHAYALLGRSSKNNGEALDSKIDDLLDMNNCLSNSAQQRPGGVSAGDVGSEDPGSSLAVASASLERLRQSKPDDANSAVAEPDSHEPQSRK